MTAVNWIHLFYACVNKHLPLLRLNMSQNYNAAANYTLQAAWWWCPYKIHEKQRHWTNTYPCAGGNERPSPETKTGGIFAAAACFCRRRRTAVKLIITKEAAPSLKSWVDAGRQSPIHLAKLQEELYDSGNNCQWLNFTANLLVAIVQEYCENKLWLHDHDELQFQSSWRKKNTSGILVMNSFLLLFFLSCVTATYAGKKNQINLCTDKAFRTSI